MRGSIYHCGACPYLPNREFQVFIPEDSMEAHYRQLMDIGFRRNGDLIYHTHCPDCSACEATRVHIDGFHMRRDQRRCWKRNQDLIITTSPVGDDDAHRALFTAYEEAVHQNDCADYAHLLEHAGQNCISIEARDAHGALYAVTLVDVFNDAISSVYCYYRPDEKARALGTFMALQEIAYCRQHNKSWLYLGFYVAQCRKLAYKARYRPLQIYRNNHWQWFDPEDTTNE